MRIFENVADLAAAQGDDLGWTDWLVIDQEKIDAFAALSGDDQWIHVNRDRAAEGPFGTTVAHGFLTLSMLPTFNRQVYRVRSKQMALNYGVNKVRFPSPLPSGSRIRAHAELLEVTEKDHGAQVVIRYTIEREGGTKPVCVAESVGRIFV